jgi:hypothetical protein
MLTSYDALSYFQVLLERMERLGSPVTACLSGGHLLRGTLRKDSLAPGAWLLLWTTPSPHSALAETRFHVSQVVAVTVEVVG